MVTSDNRKLEEAEFHDTRERDRQTLSDEEFNRKYSNKKWYAISDESNDFVDSWLRENCAGKTVLDFGCGLGGMSARLAGFGANVFAIDISEESVATTRKAVTDAGYPDKINAAVMDGENLKFENDKFDVIVCSGVLHHVDVNAVFPELARVLKPTGTVIAMEALGYNPLIALYRRLTPKLRTSWEADHILTMKELNFAKKYFDECDVKFFYLLSIAAIAVRNTPIFKPVKLALRAIDRVILKIPGVQLMAWQMIFFLRKPKRPSGRHQNRMS